MRSATELSDKELDQLMARFRTKNVVKKDKKTMPRKVRSTIDGPALMKKFAQHKGTRGEFIEKEGVSVGSFYKALKENPVAAQAAKTQAEPKATAAKKRHKQSSPIVGTPAGMTPKRKVATPTAKAGAATGVHLTPEEAGVASQDAVVAYLTKENANLKRLLANAWRVALK